MPLANGDVFAGYRIQRPLGFGGMGEVYLAGHPRLPRWDALKILPAQMSADAGFRARFNREAELAASLYHPHVVGIHDRGEFNGQLWISMDYVDGPDAGRLLRERYPDGMPAPLVAEIVAAVGDALDYAHSRGLLHRDVKPPNILLTNPERGRRQIDQRGRRQIDQRGRRQIVLADFGIARSAAETHGLTETNMTVGTVNYASPEQLMGAAIDARADQYGLAATAYHLLTGSPMFGSSNPAAVIGRHLNAPPPRLADVHPSLARLDPVLATALSKDPRGRFRTCSDFADALKQAVDGPAPLPPPWPPGLAGPAPRPQAPPRAAPAPPPVGQHTAILPPEHQPPREPVAPGPARWRWALAAAAVALVLGALAVAMWPRHPDGGPAAPGTATSATSPAVATPPAPTAPAASPTSTSTTPAAPVGFDAMRDLVMGFYGELPANARTAWEKLDAHYQRRNGLDGYLGFWSTIQSVSVLSVSPRDATSVTATIRYVLRDGRVDTENRWLSFASDGGRLLIHDSERIGPA